MDNKFKSNSPEEAKAWLTEMFKQGAEWNAGGREIKLVEYEFYFCEDGKVSISSDANYWIKKDLPKYSPILTPDFSNVQAGDRVRCLMYGEGVVVAVDTNGSFPIYVKFLNGNYASYTLNGCFSGIASPTLFYHFTGQFPTAEACVRPKPDAYELHGVTRGHVAEIAKAVELIAGFKPKRLTWANTGKPLFWDSEPQREGKGWKGGRFCKAEVLRKPAPYEHWQTPIVLGGE